MRQISVSYRKNLIDLIAKPCGIVCSCDGDSPATLRVWREVWSRSLKVLPHYRCPFYFGERRENNTGAAESGGQKSRRLVCVDPLEHRPGSWRFSDDFRTRA